MSEILIKKEVKVPGTNVILEKGDKIVYKEADDPKPKFICVSSDKDLKDSVKLPDRVVLTNGGAFDLEQKGKSGWYVWVGYEHKGWKSEPTMQSVVARTAEEVGRWLSKTYTGKYNVDNFWKTQDMFRVWVEDTSGKIQRYLNKKKNESLGYINAPIGYVIKDKDGDYYECESNDLGYKPKGFAKYKSQNVDLYFVKDINGALICTNEIDLRKDRGEQLKRMGIKYTIIPVYAKAIYE